MQMEIYHNKIITISIIAFSITAFANLNKNISVLPEIIQSKKFIMKLTINVIYGDSKIIFQAKSFLLIL
jgi:hypothetical protein